jgi:hypothetical protein
MVQQARIVVQELEAMNRSLETLIGFLTLVGLLDSADGAAGPSRESRTPAAQNGELTA